MRLRTTPLHPAFGVEVLDVELRTVTSQGGYPALRAAFEEYSLLLFRGQALDDEAHLRFASLFGPIEDRSAGADGDAPRMDNVSNRLADGTIAAADDLHTLDLSGNQLWHTDSIFLPVPALANVLAARVLSSTGGETDAHVWRPGDVLVWDERAILHRGRPWPYHEERTLASVCVSATEADGLASIRPPSAPQRGS